MIELDAETKMKIERGLAELNDFSSDISQRLRTLSQKEPSWLRACLEDIRQSELIYYPLPYIR